MELLGLLFSGIFQSSCNNLHSYEKTVETESLGYSTCFKALEILHLFHFSHSGLLCSGIILGCKFAFP